MATSLQWIRDNHHGEERRVDGSSRLRVRRYLHSVVSAGIEYGLHEERIVQLMLEAGLIEDTKLPHGRIHFDAGKAHHILTEALKTLTSRDVRNELGISERAMNEIFQRGLLPRVEPRTGSESGEKIWTVFGSRSLRTSPLVRSAIRTFQSGVSASARPARSAT
ncbi:hypothetical protein FHT71_001145 [Rhizobium sp. BK060]|nr:hypothetical protein [Rhizobium sp. BK060]